MPPPTRPPTIAAVGAALVMQAACGLSPDTRLTRNTGRLCLSPTTASPSGSPLAAGEPMSVEVVLDDCGSPCNEVLVRRCSATRDGSTIRVTSTLKIKDTDRACPPVCQRRTATCPLGELPAGRYRLVHGHQPVTRFTIPADTPVCADGGGPI